MRWRTRPSNQKSYIVIEEDPEDVGLYMTIRERTMARPPSPTVEDDEENEKDAQSYLSVFKRPRPKKRPVEDRIEEEGEDLDAELQREKQKICLELQQAEDFSLHIENEETGDRVYLQPDGSIVPYDENKRKECKQILAERLDSFVAMRNIQNKGPRRKSLKVDEPTRTNQVLRDSIYEPGNKENAVDGLPSYLGDDIEPKETDASPHASSDELHSSVFSATGPHITSEDRQENLSNENIDEQMKKACALFEAESYDKKNYTDGLPSYLGEDIEPKETEASCHTISEELLSSVSSTSGPHITSENGDDAEPKKTEAPCPVSSEELQSTVSSASGTNITLEDRQENLSDENIAVQMKEACALFESDSPRNSEPIPAKLQLYHYHDDIDLKTPGKRAAKPRSSFSKLNLSPIENSLRLEYSPQTGVLTSTPVVPKFVTSTPLTTRGEDSLFGSVYKENEALEPTTALNGTEFGNTTNFSTAINATGIAKTRNFTQIVSFYENVSQTTSKVPYYLAYYNGPNDAYHHLMHLTGQTVPISWKQMEFKNVKKLGEGQYGEVFATTYMNQKAAVKIIPFNNNEYRYDETVNGENLFESEELIAEVLISREVSSLYDPTAKYSTPNFIRLLGAHVLQGTYPQVFLKAWDAWKKRRPRDRPCENIRPSKYATETQLFLAICLAQGGTDLESKTLNNEDQVFSVVVQVAISLIIAEKNLEFEHRDLHWGNILVEDWEGDIEYNFDGSIVKIQNHGVKVNIIDFTHSRLKKSGTVLYRDVENDEQMFTGQGDYQFQIYREMRKEINKNWMGFTPKTNIWWMHYLIRQLVVVKDCKKPISAKRKEELMKVFDLLPQFDTLLALFTEEVFTAVLKKYLAM